MKKKIDIEATFQKIASHFCDSKVIFKKKLPGKSKTCLSTYIRNKNEIWMLKMAEVKNNLKLSDAIAQHFMLQSLFHEIYHAKNIDKYIEKLYHKQEKEKEKLIGKINKYFSENKSLKNSSKKLSKKELDRLSQKIPPYLYIECLSFLNRHNYFKKQMLSDPKDFYKNNHPMNPHEEKADKWAEEKINYYYKDYKKKGNKIVRLITTKGKYWKD